MGKVPTPRQSMIDKLGRDAVDRLAQKLSDAERFLLEAVSRCHDPRPGDNQAVENAIATLMASGSRYAAAEFASDCATFVRIFNLRMECDELSETAEQTGVQYRAVQAEIKELTRSGIYPMAELFKLQKRRDDIAAKINWIENAEASSRAEFKSLAKSKRVVAALAISGHQSDGRKLVVK